MIFGSDWVWLHFPKCAGNTVQHLLKINCIEDETIRFDPIDPANVIWHENIPTRLARDPACDVGGKKVIANIRRLPEWILSRVHYEAARPPYRVVSREMLIKGEFYENYGGMRTADEIIAYYDTPKVDVWIPVENLHAGLEHAIGRRLEPISEKLNENSIPYIRNVGFWFTREELAALYDRCSRWAEVEERIYGGLLV